VTIPNKSVSFNARRGVSVLVCVLTMAGRCGAVEFSGFFLKSPFASLQIGSSQSGKTWLVADIIRHWKHVVPDAPPIGRFRLVYSVYQKVYDDILASLEPSCEVELMTEIPLEKFESDKYWEMEGELENKSQVIFFDDCGPRITSNKKLGEIMETLFCIRKHHNRACVLMNLQNLVPSDVMRSCLRNSNYIFFTRSLANSSLYVSLQKMIFGGQPGILTAAADVSMNADSHRYLLVDLSVDCPGQYRLRAGVLPGEASVIYSFV